jgi:hypothetical protein
MYLCRREETNLCKATPKAHLPIFFASVNFLHKQSSPADNGGRKREEKERSRQMDGIRRSRSRRMIPR